MKYSQAYLSKACPELGTAQPQLVEMFLVFYSGLRSGQKNILNSIRNIEDRLDLLQEKSYDIELNSSEFKEINKRKRKLEKDKQKLVRKLNQLH